MDLDKDDYKDGDVFKEWQEIILDTAGIIVSTRWENYNECCNTNSFITQGRVLEHWFCNSQLLSLP